MRRRIRYLELTHDIKPDARKEVLRHCGHCTAKLFLEVRASVENAVVPEPSLSPSPCTPCEPPPSKRARSAQECVQELQNLKQLLDEGLLTADEFANLKGRLLNGD